MQQQVFRDSCDPKGIPDTGAPDQYSAYEGASAPPFELMENGMKNTGSSVVSKPVVKEVINLSITLCSIHTIAGDKSGQANQLALQEHEEFSPCQTELNTVYVSEQDIKEALLQYVSSKCFYRTAPAKHMKVQNLIPLNTYRYHLETFTEHRETHRASELYKGGFVDSCAVAPPPALWEIEVDPPPLFTDCEMHIPVPHTYSVEHCPNCKGRGRTECTSCNGTGKELLWSRRWRNPASQREIPSFCEKL
uniref:Uncharacterized protein n=1 Tax=Sphaerodactylus townsendi TaxID=933632 RepID=A0ACB8EH73_9SAUR